MAGSLDHSIEPLSEAHDHASFDCGEQWLDSYIRRHAVANQQLGYGRTYVAVPRGARLVHGYYTLAMGSVHFANLPDALASRVPRYPMPVAHLGCLAVDMRARGMGLGDLLLIDAFRRIVSAADVVAARALEVKAISDFARQWYLARGFLPFRDDPLHLYLPIDAIRTVLAQV